MKGAEDYLKEKITDFDQVSVKTLDDHTPYLLSLLQQFRGTDRQCLPWSQALQSYVISAQS